MAILYEAYTAGGQRIAGTLAVESAAEAEEQLWRSNLTITSLKPERNLRKELLRQIYRQLPTLFRPRAQELVGFTRELSSLLHAGIPLHQALALLMDRIANPLLKDALVEITHDIQGGTNISAAVAKHPAVFSPLYNRLLIVGEETGTLEMALSQLADYMEKQAALTRKVTGALRYPSLVMLVGITAGYFMVNFSLPALTGLLKEFGGELPASAKLLIAGQDFASQYGQWVLLGVGALALSLVVYSRTAAGARQRDSFMLRVPVVGKVVRTAAMFRFISTLFTMLSAGLPLVEALELAARATPNTTVRSVVLSVRDDLLQGQSFSQALSRQPLFPALLPQMVAVGEQSGTLSQNLETLARFYDQETDRAVTSLTGLIEPAMILTMGGVVGFMAITIASSLYGSLSQIR